MQRRAASRRAAAALALVLALPGCAEREPTAPELAELPEPELGAFEPGVRDQLVAERRALEERRAQGGPAPELAAAFGRLGRLYHAYDLLEPAAACYENARLLAPADYRWPAYLGALHHQRGELAAAATATRAALELRPDEAPLLLRLGRVELARGDPEAARAPLRAAIAADPRCAAAHFALGEAARAGDDHAAAVGHFRDTLAVQPGASQVFYPLAQSLLRLGREDEAAEPLRRAGEREVAVGGAPGCADPLTAELAALKGGAAAHLSRALEAQRDGDLAGEIAAYRSAVEEDPADPIARQGLGSALLRSGELEAAHREYREAVRLAPESAPLHSDLGVVAVRLDRLEEAAGHFRRARELDPEAVLYRLQVASLARRRGRCAEALPLFDEVLAAEPANRQARSQRALCLAETGRPGEAAAELAVLIEEEPPADPAERLQVASLLLSLGGEESALGHFQAVLAQPAPAAVHARAHLLIGQVLRRRGELEQAAASFAAAVELDPALAEAVAALEPR